jgi:eukaryotic-like serine/threonine-protein kinase
MTTLRRVRTGDVVAGRYQLEDARGSGSGGVVWTAFDRKLKRTVALKRPHAVARDTDRVQFRREAQTAAQVHHPNAISVFDTVDAGECWLVMEYLAAESLDKVLADNGPLPPERAARIGLQIAGALVAVHARKIVHRDVKPGNILVTDDDLAKLTDFGISIWREVTRTDDGKISGTPAYIAPEVAGGQPASEASDVFSLGAPLFAAVEGTPPFGTGAPHEMLQRARDGEMLPMRHAGSLALLLADMLAPNPAKRPTADQVRQRLQKFVGDWEPPPSQVAAAVRTPVWRRLRYPVLIAAALVVAVSAAGFAVVDSRSDSAEAFGPDLIGDERTADPCALLDQDPLRRFGPTQLYPAEGNFNRCDVMVNAGGMEPVDVEVQLLRRKQHPVRGEPFEDEGSPDDDECALPVMVDDQYGIQVSAKVPNPPVNLCTVADAAKDTAERVLRQGPLPRRTPPFPAESLAHVDACSLLDSTALAAYPSIDPATKARGFGNWGCKWYSMADRIGVHLRYDQHSALVPVDGKTIQLGDHEAYVAPNTDSSVKCTVSVRHRPPNPTPRTTIDLMVLTVTGDRPGAEYCSMATSLAAAAAAKLPP